MGCYEGRPVSSRQSDHKGGKKKNKEFTEMAWERLSREIKLMKAVTQSNQVSDFEQSRAKIMEFYSEKKLKCKGKKGYECNYMANQAWCKACGYIDFSDEDLRSFDDFSCAGVKQTKQLHVQLIGPDNTPYNRKFTN